MDAPVRFVRSRDGTRIAYTVEGAGPPLIRLLSIVSSHVELYPRQPGAREFFADISARRTLVRIDLRGTGMSDRDIVDHSQDALTDDLAAVVDALGLEQPDIWTTGQRFMAALRFAARRPHGVRKLILTWPIGAAPAAGSDPGAVPGVFHLAESNWELFLQTVAQRVSGRQLNELQDMVAFFGRCTDQRNWLAEVASTRPEEDWDLARTITAPTLIIYADGSLETAERTAAFARRFPNGRLVRLPTEAAAPPFSDGMVLEAVEEFLGPVEIDGDGHSQVRLTAREREVLVLLAAGQTEPEIGTSLCISRATVSRHVMSVYAKLGVHRKAEAVSWAIRHGIEHVR